MRRGQVRGFVALAALALVACGGEDKGRPSGERTVAPEIDECALAAEYETRDIVTFESGQASTCAEPLACSFYFNYDDRTVQPNQAGEGAPKVPDSPLCLSLEPADTDPKFSLSPTPKPAPGGPRCGTSNGVIRLKALNIGQCFGKDGRLGWGASLELKFVTPGNANIIQPLDAGDSDGTGPWEGIGFWVKKASDVRNVTAQLTILDDASDAIEDPEHPVNHCGCIPNEDGKTFHCYSDPSKVTQRTRLDGSVEDFTFPDELKCDPFGTAFTITDEWSFVRVNFAEMTQKGFGFPLESLDVSNIRRLQFLVNNGSTDFYMDDIVLFRKK